MNWIKTLSIISISLQFVSFWFAAPEVLGREWLQKAEVLLRKGIKTIPGFIMLLLGAAIGMLTPKSFRDFNLKILIPLVLFFLVMVVFSKKIQQILDKKIAAPLLNKLIISVRF